MNEISNSGLSNILREGSHQFTLGEKIAGALGALRMRFFPRRNLIAGPYVGEFGHELMDWQAWVRGQVGRHKETHVITYPGRDYLYPAPHVHYHGIALESAGYKHGRFSPSELEAMARSKAGELGIKDYDLLTPVHVCTRYHQRFLLPAKFELLSKPPVAERIRDVAFHFRRVKKEGPDQTRNYPVELCDKVAALCEKQGLSIFCVGHPGYSWTLSCRCGGPESRGTRSQRLGNFLSAPPSRRVERSDASCTIMRCADPHLGGRPVAY